MHELKENDVSTTVIRERVTCRNTVANTTARTRRTVTISVPCRAGNPDLWFAESPAQLEEAKALCASCPIRQGCLSAALDRAEPWGVWGGEIFDQGVVIARKRPRGRPRKVAVA
ncbi:WhiB family transcriptional regulator [Nocardia tengchongensis]|uniref:Transcriptional regulator WhiB n=1 Tax=Nocardia tengchongensis TaxID=2055889 RepID=A0ABX8CV19_9NOCA|nr:WhiB family transcriptional regulator [Nocardia tengchongensis]QVI23735.1 WhiB family transcriptional regulator [Nocardia tengchongensis]